MDVRRVTGSFVGAASLCLLGLMACGDDRAKEGEPCDVAADCENELVCALVATNAKDHECTPMEDTFPQDDCVPGADLTMPCDLVQKQPAGKPCATNSQCREGLSCDFVDSSATDSVCTKR